MYLNTILCSHPPTAHPTSTLLQCMHSLCNSGCAHSVHVSCEYPHYVCACAPVPHVILYSNSLHTSSTLWHIYSTCEHTDMYMQSQTTPTKQRGRSSYSTHVHLGRQAGNQHVFITGLVIHTSKSQQMDCDQLSLE